MPLIIAAQMFFQWIIYRTEKEKIKVKKKKLKRQAIGTGSVNMV